MYLSEEEWEELCDDLSDHFVTDDNFQQLCHEVENLRTRLEYATNMVVALKALRDDQTLKSIEAEQCSTD